MGFFNAASGLIVVVPLIKSGGGRSVVVVVVVALIESGKGRSVVVVVVTLKVSVPLKG